MAIAIANATGNTVSIQERQHHCYSRNRLLFQCKCTAIGMRHLPLRYGRFRARKVRNVSYETWKVLWTNKPIYRLKRFPNWSRCRLWWRSSIRIIIS